jgi:hypothetical protein
MLLDLLVASMLALPLLAALASLDSRSELLRSANQTAQIALRRGSNTRAMALTRCWDYTGIPKDVVVWTDGRVDAPDCDP